MRPLLRDSLFRSPASSSATWMQSSADGASRQRSEEPYRFLQRSPRNGNAPSFVRSYWATSFSATETRIDCAIIPFPVEFAVNYSCVFPVNWFAAGEVQFQNGGLYQAKEGGESGDLERVLHGGEDEV